MNNGAPRAGGEGTLFIIRARKKQRSAFTLSAGVILVYFAFVLVMALRPDWLAPFVWAGSVVSVGILGAFLLILAICAVMGGYVYWRTTAKGGEIPPAARPPEAS